MSEPLSADLGGDRLCRSPLFRWARWFGRARLLPRREPGEASSGPSGSAGASPSPDSHPRPSILWTRQTWAGVLALLAIHSLLLGWLAAVYSPTYDEPGHLAAGYRIWTAGSVDLYIVNPPLVKTVAAWPLLFFQPKTDWARVIDSPGYRPEFSTGRVFLAENPDTWYWMMTTARWACIPLSLIGAVVAFQWAREVFGATSGWIALVLWTFDPNLLGNGCLLAPDVGGSAMGLVAGYLFWKWLEWASWERAGLGLGLALLSKATLLVFGPLWVVLWVLSPFAPPVLSPFAPRKDILSRSERRHSWGGEGLQLMFALLLSCYVLNLGYGFKGTGTRLKDFEFVSYALGGERRAGQVSSNKFRETQLGELPIPVPREFVLGLDMQKKDFEFGRWTFLAGRWKWGGWWYFYLAAIAIKSPLGYGVLLLAALGVVWRGEPTLRRPVLAIVLPIMAIIGFVSREQGFTTFVRYVLPALPFALVLLAGVGRWVDQGSKLARYGVGVTLAWIVSTSVWCLPFSFSYFNELIGGPGRGHEYLFDSNLDWGQDLYFVRDWVERHPEARPLTLSWNDIFDPELAGLNLPLTPNPPNREGGQVGPHPDSSFEGWHIVCVNNLHSADQRYAYLRELEPVDRIGYSVMVYHLDEEQARKAKARISPPLLPPDMK